MGTIGQKMMKEMKVSFLEDAVQENMDFVIKKSCH